MSVAVAGGSAAMDSAINALSAGVTLPFPGASRSWRVLIFYLVSEQFVFSCSLLNDDDDYFPENI